MADKKISELTAITGADTAADDYFIVVDTSGSATKKISRAELNNAIEQDVLAQVDITSANIDGGTIDNTPIGASTPSTGAFTTLTADGLTVDSGTTDTVADFRSTDTSALVRFTDGTGSTYAGTTYQNGNGAFAVYTGGDTGGAGSHKSLIIDGGGDVSLYDSTGVTQGFYWDASTQGLAVGTTSTSSEKLRLKQSTDSSIGGLGIESSDGYGAFMGREAGSTGAFTIRNNGSDTLSIKSGNVGIGTSPSAKLDVAGQIISSDSFKLTGNVSTPTGNAMFRPASNTLAFATNSIERMRIDSSGNLLVGKSGTSNQTEGFALVPNGSSNIVRDGGAVMQMNRKTSDGDILQFLKGATTVGSIGTYSGLTTINSGTFNRGLLFGDSIIRPQTTNGVNLDATLGLGTASSRFTNLYLSSGVYLGGTVSANLLDDYEEGTWTPSADSGLGGASGATGKYTKVGRSVYCFGTMVVTDITADIVIGGLPFTNGDRTSTVTAFLAGGVTTVDNHFVNSSATTFNIKRTGTYSGVGISIYFACWYFI